MVLNIKDLRHEYEGYSHKYKEGCILRDIFIGNILGG